jgi:BatD DUF11 like domain
MNARKLMKLTSYPLLFALLCLPQLVWSVPIEVEVKPTPASLDESFQIVFSATETPDEAPDFSVLEVDFSILNQSQSSSTVIDNGNLSKVAQWTLNVMAKRAGRLTIPAIKFGDDSSSATSVTVVKSTTKKSVNSDSELFLDVKATPETVFVQSQVLYTMRLYTKAKIVQAKLTEPELNDAVIEKLGEDSNYTTLYNGTTYEVVERKYVIFPQKSGQLVINPLELIADVVTQSAPSFNDFFSSQITKTKRVVSKKIILNVKPAPASFTGQHWISAEQLELTQAWSGDIGQVKVGEPLTRTLTLQAKSTTVGQLPELNSAKNTEQLKVYPDQPVLQEQKNQDGLLASRQEKIALIPSKAGSFTLPAVQIPWFNTRSQKMEVASLPEVMVTALAVPGVAPVVEAAPVKPVLKAESVKPIQPAKIVAKPVLQTPVQRPYNKWLWGACVFFAAGWLITLVYFFSKRPAKKTLVPESEHDISIRESVKRLKKACANNDVEKAKVALMDWGNKQFGATSLGAVAQFCEARLRDEILQLNQIVYGKDAEAWDGKKLFQYFIENKARTAIANKDNSLEPLYRL